jgi:dinuclear metal center YbgI/SA1388 family protein
MTDTVGDWLHLLHARYPPGRAASWDNVGLQVGDPVWPVERVLVTLDVTSAVVDEAAAVAHTLVIAHHPLLFRPLRTLTPDSATGRVALSAASRRVAVAAAHTNLDAALDGTSTSSPVADLLGLADRASLGAELTDAAHCKLVTFVPEEAVEGVLDALAAAGAGRIGGYERCAFHVRGTGTFLPSLGADPYIGTRGQVAEVDERRIEMVVPRRLAGAAVAALLDAHPYEEVAYDLVAMLDGADRGPGMIGRLPDTLALDEVAEHVRAELPAPGLRVAGDGRRRIARVAVVGGAGEALIPAATAAGADLLITGDLRHHVVLDALEDGLCLIDAGHHATESAAMPRVADALRADARARGLEAPVLASASSTMPWR